MASKKKELIERLEAFPVVDPRGYTNAKYRETLNQLLREMSNRIAALEAELQARRAGLPGYD